MQQKLMKRTAIYCFCFFILAMTGMLYYDATKIIVIADAGTDMGSGTGEDPEMVIHQIDTQYQLLFGKSKESKDAIVIPLEDGIKAENVVVENHYMDRELWIGINGGSTAFYETSAITGNLKQIIDGGYDYEDGTLWIKLELQNVYEFQSTMENNSLTVEYVKPSELYDKIIVLDAGHGGDDIGIKADATGEKDITLNIALLLREKLAQSDIKVYFTRTGDETIPEENRVQLADELDADMLISIHANDSEDESRYGIVTTCNSRYFIQDFNSVDLADILEQEVVKATDGYALGIEEATDEDVLLKEASIPAAMLKVGYLTNRQEEAKLDKDDYQQKIADGIYNAIMRAFEEI